MALTESLLNFLKNIKNLIMSVMIVVSLLQFFKTIIINNILSKVDITKQTLYKLISPSILYNTYEEMLEEERKEALFYYSRSCKSSSDISNISSLSIDKDLAFKYAHLKSINISLIEYFKYNKSVKYKNKLLLVLLNRDIMIDNIYGDNDYTNKEIIDMLYNIGVLCNKDGNHKINMDKKVNHEKITRAIHLIKKIDNGDCDTDGRLKRILNMNRCDLYNCKSMNNNDFIKNIFNILL